VLALQRKLLSSVQVSRFPLPIRLPILSSVAHVCLNFLLCSVLIRIQMLSELEEIIYYKQHADQPDRQATMRKTWMKRLALILHLSHPLVPSTDQAYPSETSPSGSRDASKTSRSGNECCRSEASSSRPRRTRRCGSSLPTSAESRIVSVSPRRLSTRSSRVKVSAPV
jgi:hypothetical protein